ncbi:MAG: SprT family zinc-dependent metalloprotease [Methanosarcina sp.]|uniref:M48 family metallopeptidase n=1 Tax=Methanosarcina sp. TaxID=2213 RepID=UPI00262AC2A1|nr:SprT family zinc-dependent metalloprotease [Methanosarcina sp.]MDD3247531.1 SprT family zinc-dependent metalloprotease [Methanosarcina sp.]
MRKNDSIKACGKTLDYEIVYSKKRRKAAIVVCPDLKVEFRAPHGLSREAIREMVQKKSGWVWEKLDWFEANRLPSQEKRYIDGEMYLYLGKEYTLKILHMDGIKKYFASFNGSELTVFIPEAVPEELKSILVKKAVWDFYRDCAESDVDRLLKVYSDKLKISLPVFKVKHQKRRWGSCSADNVLRINFQLMMAPPEQLEYVVVHELCHVKEKNHSARFWKLVGELMPGYEVHRKSLKKDGWRYVL